MNRYKLTQTDRLVFIHILKTAGQTLMPILESYFDSDKTLFSNWADIVETPHEELNGFNLIMGHNFWGIGDLLSETPLYITFLRDPIERTLSHYAYLSRNTKNHLYEKIRSQTLSEFLSDPETNTFVKDLQVRWIISEDRLKNGIQNERYALDKAKQRLREFAFIGVTERFSEALKLLAFTFYWEPIGAYEDRNVSKNRLKKQDISLPTLDLIKNVTQLDRELYHYACDLFDTRMDQMLHETTRTQLINSKVSDSPELSAGWWNGYYQNELDSHNSKYQTFDYTESIIRNLPSDVVDHLNNNTLSIIDWGCAFGDGVKLLSNTFTDCCIVGLDFSPLAIEEAKKRYPECEFYLIEDGGIDRDCDVLITSNCLANYGNPIQAISDHLSKCSQLHISLVPYEEPASLDVSYSSRFSDLSFPVKIGQFQKIYASPINVDTSIGKEQHLLTIYASSKYIEENKLTERIKWDRYYATLPQYHESPSRRLFNQQFVTMVSDFLPSGSRSLEVGAGAGWQSLALARSGLYNVVLMDFSIEAIKYAKELFERNNASAVFIQEDGFNPGKPEYDLVFNLGVLEHYEFKEQVNLLKAMASRSKKYVLVLVPNTMCYWYWVWRIQHTGIGDWPFGKEVPREDLSGLFDAAGINFLGHSYLGETWTEDFLENMIGIDDDLRSVILKVHRSGLKIPLEQRCYLIAGMGDVSGEKLKVASDFARPVRSQLDIEASEINAALADALGLSISLENQIKDITCSYEEKEAVSSAHMAELSNQVRKLTEDLTTRSAQVEQLTEKLNDTSVQVERISEKLSDEMRNVERLREELSYKSVQFDELTEKLSEKSRELEKLAKEHKEESNLSQHYSRELYDIRSRRSWQVFQKVTGFIYFFSSKFRKLYRMVVPEKIREGIWNFRHQRYVTKVVQKSQDQILDEQDQERLSNILDQHSDSEGIIIFPPSIRWNATLFQRPQHMAMAFAQLGYLVLFMLPSNDREYSHGFTDIQPGLYLSNVPVTVLGKLIHNPILIVYTYNSHWKAHFNDPVLIYEYLDELEVFSEFSADELRQYHDELVKSADHVVGISDKLVEELSRSRPDAILSTNGVRFEHFAKITNGNIKVPEDLKVLVTSGQNVIGYYGAIARWLDYELIKFAADALQDCLFIFIGPDHDNSIELAKITEIDNIHWLGSRPYESLPSYLFGFDVATIPFKVNTVTNAVSPLKLFEFMAGGRPIVTTNLAECRKYPCVLTSETYEDYIKNIRKALSLKRDKLYVQQLQQTARENSWLSQAQNIVKVLKKQTSN